MNHMALLALILFAFLILGTGAQSRLEKHQLVGAFRGIITSVYEKILLEFSSVR